MLVLVPGVIIQKTSAKSDFSSWLGRGWAGLGLGLAWLGLRLRFFNIGTLHRCHHAACMHYAAYLHVAERTPEVQPCILQKIGFFGSKDS